MPQDATDSYSAAIQSHLSPSPCRRRNKACLFLFKVTLRNTSAKLLPLSGAIMIRLRNPVLWAQSIAFGLSLTYFTKLSLYACPSWLPSSFPLNVRVLYVRNWQEQIEMLTSGQICLLSVLPNVISLNTITITHCVADGCLSSSS